MAVLPLPRTTNHDSEITVGMEDSFSVVTGMMRGAIGAETPPSLLPLRCGPNTFVRRHNVVTEAMMKR